MTKLLEWVFVTSVILGVWSSVITRTITHPILDQWMHIILPLPLIIICLFGLYAVAVVLFRVFTFNDCQDAAEELQQQILEAKADLKKRGFVFRSDNSAAISDENPKTR